jgi:hypothetical protein
MSEAKKSPAVETETDKTLVLKKQTVKRLSIRSSIKTGMPMSCLTVCRTTCGCAPPPPPTFNW